MEFKFYKFELEVILKFLELNFLKSYKLLNIFLTMIEY